MFSTTKSLSGCSDSCIDIIVYRLRIRTVLLRKVLNNGRNPGGGGRAAAVRATVRRLTHRPRTGWREMKTCCPGVAESKEITTFAMSLADYPVRMP